MRRLELSVGADADLFDILAYGTAVHGDAASNAYYAGLIDTFAFLCATPGAGQVDEETGLNLRRWRYRQYRIFYRSDDETVGIVRVFHVAADVVRGLGP